MFFPVFEIDWFLKNRLRLQSVSITNQQKPNPTKNAIFGLQSDSDSDSIHAYLWFSV